MAVINGKIRRMGKMENKLKAGAGKAEIVFPDELFPIEGFCCVHDNPHIRVLLLEAGITAAIVSMEIVMSTPKIDKWIISRLKQRFDIAEENIWIHVTHAITTPHAPGGPVFDSNMNEEAAKKRKLYTQAIENAAGIAIDNAVSSFQEALYGVGTGACDVNVNRDVETKKGWWIGLNGTGLSNKVMTLIQFKGLSGNIIASLISYGIKPCAIDNSQMSENKRQISSDVPGFACSIAEKATGAPVMFCMAAAGDQVPKKQAWYDVADDGGNIKTIDNGVEIGLKLVEKYGTEMGDAAITIAESISDYNGCMEINMEKGEIPWSKKKRTQMRISRETQFETDESENIPWSVMTIGDVAIAATKPEMNCISEKQLAEKSHYKHTLLITMVNGGMKYMPDKASYNNNTWEAQSSMLMPGAAEAFVEKVADEINDL
jgi:hypothetical protein